MEAGENTEKMSGFILEVDLLSEPIAYEQDDASFKVFATAPGVKAEQHYPQIYVRTKITGEAPAGSDVTTAPSINVIGVVGEEVFYEKNISSRFSLLRAVRTAAAQRRAAKVVQSGISPLVH